MYYSFGQGPFFFGFGWIFSLIFWFLVIWLIFGLIFGSRRRHHRLYRGWGSSNALDVLNERYAKGEISKQEYEEKKKDLLS